MGREESLLREELAELRARESRHRDELQRQLDLSKRLREYATHLRGALRDGALDSTAAVFAQVAEVSAEALGVDRVSVWLFDAGRGVLACEHLHVRGVGPRVTREIPVSEVLGYVRALTTDLLAVDDVTTDPRMLELRSYCADRGIGAILDVPVVVEGEVLGVVCHEHIGPRRPWHDAEIEFAASLGSMVALAIEVERRHEVQARAREIEHRRLEAERRYRELIEHVDLIGVVLDAGGAIVAVNDAFARVAGVARGEAIGQSFVETYVAPDERARVRGALADGIRARERPARFEAPLVDRDGAPHTIVWSATLLYDDTGAVTGTASLGLDLTERNRLEAELAQQHRFESLGRMAAGVAHDFNNVLTVLSLSIAHGGKGTEIATAMSYARELVSSLLSYARRDPVAVSDVDIDAAIGELAPVLATAIGKDLRLELDLFAGARVRIAPTELRQLVVNIVTNAGEATRGHGHAVRIATRAVSRPTGRQIELRIIDDGRGMDEATRARVFDPFFTTKPPGEGTGIGLATCQSIVSRAGGAIAIESRPGLGTTFRIVLPVASGEASVAAPHPAGGGPVEHHRVLLVEDSPTIGGLVTGVLRDAGYDIVHVATVAEALEAIATTRFGIVIADLQMPDGRGEEVIAAARAGSTQTAIVIASGEVTVINGVDGVVLKPFTPDELKEGIDRAVAHRREAEPEQC